MKSKILLASAIVGLLGTSMTFAGGHSSNPIASAIKARQGQMGLYQHNLEVLGAMAKGDVDYNAETAQAAADNILALSGLNAMTMWPQGSDMGSVEGTRAKAEIWSNFPDVGAKLGDMSAAANEMAGAAGGGLDGLRAAMGTLGGACNACHKDYRGRR